MPDSTELTPQTVVDIMRSERFVMLSTVASDGAIVSHPMTPLEVTDDADVFFILSAASEQATELKASPQVNLAFAEVGSWLSVAGRAEFVDDEAKVSELWNDEIGSYFEQGPSDPDVALLKVVGDSAQYWGIPGNRVAAAAKMVVAKLKGDRAPGLSGKTEL